MDEIDQFGGLTSIITAALFALFGNLFGKKVYHNDLSSTYAGPISAGRSPAIRLGL